MATDGDDNAYKRCVMCGRLLPAHMSVLLLVCQSCGRRLDEESYFNDRWN